MHKAIHKDGYKDDFVFNAKYTGNRKILIMQHLMIYFNIANYAIHNAIFNTLSHSII